MTAAKTWAAAGSAATMLAGGLLLGAPAAVAAPGDPACVQAAGQFDAALTGAGLTPDSLMALDASAEAVAAAEALYATLVEGAGGPSLQELEAAAAALVAAQQSGDPQAVAAAEARLAELEAALTAALESVDPAVAQQALTEAAARFEALLAAVGLDEATVNGLLVLLEQAVVACEGTVPQAPVVAPAPVTAPVAPAPVAAPVAPAPVAPVPAAAAAPGEAAAVAVNPGLNMQTAASEAGPGPGAGLLAVLLTAGVAVLGTIALLVRRRARP
ncbi:hypothetical protein ACH9EU_05355 [Kocuria sp. M1R5S2]|uniref:hypothetical protein n=1 Tax=Kocuria rhizosphaerae TaxID=3376285 RepID=UPI0037B3FC75